MNIGVSKFIILITNTDAKGAYLTFRTYILVLELYNQVKIDSQCSNHMVYLTNIVALSVCILQANVDNILILVFQQFNFQNNIWNIHHL